MSRSVLHPSLRPSAAALAVLAVLAAALPGPARAAPQRLPGPSSLTLGLVDYPLFQPELLGHGPPSASWLDRARAVGASIIRLRVPWSQVAPVLLPRRFDARNPADRNYRWAALDEAVRSATRHGEQVLLLVSVAPTWAEGPGRPARGIAYGTWMPNAQKYAAFAHAVALRYSGRYSDPLHPGRRLPRVSYFQAWNEPNLSQYLEPQWVQDSRGHIFPESPTIYRGLLNAFYAAVKAVQPAAVVLSAGTAPYGDPPGLARMYPVDFLRELFCLTPRLTRKGCADPPHLDGLDHHPYSATPTNPAHNAGDISVPDLGKISRIVRAAQRAHTALPAGPKPLWITEIDWSSNPPNRNALSPARQARYVALAFYEVWRQGVGHVFWYQLRDPLTPSRSFTGGGLYFANGIAKPAAAAYRFPFVALAVPHHRGTWLLWGKAPTTGAVVISKLAGGAWRRVGLLSTTRGGIFYGQLRLGERLQLRATIGQDSSPAWATG